MLSDLECRQRMIEWIWDYGNKCIEARLKYKGELPPGAKEQLRLLTNPCNSTTIKDQAKTKNQANGEIFASQGFTPCRL